MVLEVEHLVAAWVHLSVLALRTIPALCLPPLAADVRVTVRFVVCGFAPYIFKIPGWIGTCRLTFYCVVCDGFTRVGCPPPPITGLVAGGSHRGVGAGENPFADSPAG